MSARREELRALWRLALPIVVTNLGTQLMTTVDLLMTGNYSKDALAAAGIASVWIHGTTLFAMGIVFGIDPIVTQAHGAGDGPRAGRALQRGLVVALASSVVLALLWTFTEAVLLLAKQDPAAARAAQEYTRVQIPSIPFFMAFVALRQYLQGREILSPILIVIFVANAFNALFNWGLIFGRAGLPELGLVGAGWATSLTRVVMCIGLVWMIRARRLHAGAWEPWSRAAWSREGLGQVLRYGVPIGLQLGLEVWAFGASTLMAGSLGTTSAAAHVIVLNLASITFMLPMGVSFAAVTRVGNLIGAGRPDRARTASWVAFGLGALVMGSAGLVFLLGRDVLPSFWTDDASVVAAAATILPIAAAFQVFDGVQVVGSGILRGMGDTRPAALFNLIGYWVLALPLGWWMAFRAGLALSGVWWGLAIGLAIVAVCLVAWVRARGPR
jgi:MATE family multidrug resistance protein